MANFITMEKYCISLPQAKRLVELGFKRESEYYWCDLTGYLDEPMCTNLKSVINDVKIKYPAYHVGKLGEILEHWLGVIRYEEDWVVDHWTERGGELKVRLITEAQARGRLLIYLLENKLI